MKKILFILLGILISANLVFAISLDEFEGIKSGTYKCPQKTEFSNTCVVTLYKHGGRSLSNCGNDKKAIADLIKNNKCKFEPDESKYYSCQYAEGSCEVTIRKEGHGVTCMGTVPPTSEVLKQAQEGKCYLEE